MGLVGLTGRFSITQIERIMLFLSNGFMYIRAKKETYTNQNVTKAYTSARLNSKYAFTYGKVEIRAQLPTGLGTWPALWLLGQNITENGGFWASNYGQHPGRIVERLILWNIGAIIKILFKVHCITHLHMAVPYIMAVCISMRRHHLFIPMLWSGPLRICVFM